MSLEKIHRLERLLLLLMIIALPINCLPKRFSVSTFGQSLTGYFFLLALFLLIYEFIKYKFYIPKKAIYFICIYTLWQCVCLAIGLYTYQYDSYLTIEQIPKLEWIIIKLNTFGIVLPEMQSIKCWLFGRTVKSILVIDNILFISMFLCISFVPFKFQ